MEDKIIEKLSEQLNLKRGAALVTITKCIGASPGKEGFIMGVFEDGSTIGTLGGGAMEYNSVLRASECIKKGINGTYVYDLGPEGNVGMLCGGSTEIYIKTFKAPDKLLIIGGGHVALELFKISERLNFKTVIFEDREEFGDIDRFPGAEIVLGDYFQSLSNYPIDERTYIVIVTKGHSFDQRALEAVANSSAAYIGMIGSISKTQKIMENLINLGISNQKLERVYAPIGLDIGGDTAEEIALSIISEIMMVKNKGRLRHMRERLKEDTSR